MNELTMKIMEHNDWERFFNQSENAMELLDTSCVNLLRDYPEDQLIKYVNRFDTKLPSMFFEASALFATGEKIADLLRPFELAEKKEIIEGYKTALRSKDWYQSLKATTKGLIIKKINEHADTITDTFMYHLENIKTSDDIYLCMCDIAYDGDMAIKVQREYDNQISSVPLYEHGNVVKLNNGRTFLIDAILPCHDHYDYLGMEFKSNLCSAVCESLIASLEKEQREPPVFERGMLVEVEGKLGIVQSINFSDYPYTYTIANRYVKFWAEKMKLVDFSEVFKCHVCGKYHYKGEQSNYLRLDGRYFCDDCIPIYIKTCSRCGKKYYIGDSESSTYCDECYREISVTCTYCGSRHIEETTITDVDGRRFCGPICASNYYQSRYYVNYHDKPAPVFYGASDRGYGIELEVDKMDNVETRKVGIECELRKIKEIYLKHDSSLHRGVEIITQPATVEYHRNELPWVKILKLVAKYSYTSHVVGTCGLHVHASRVMFGDTSTERQYTIAKLIYFFETEWQNIVVFSRRGSDEINHWAGKPYCSISPYDTQYDFEDKIRHNMGNRYKSINLTNTNTVEFRIFRGTTNSKTILASIEFCDSLINWCKYTELSDMMGELWTKWTDQIDEIKYPELVRYLKKHDLIKVGNK